LVNPDAVRMAERQAARLVTRVSRETRAVIRAVVVESVRGNLTPQKAAQAIRTVIGLTSRQAKAVARRRAELARTGTSQAAIDKAVDRYAAQLLRQRAMTIARTETMTAANSGQLAVWQNAQRKGLLPALAQKKWITTPDDRLCPICQPMGGQVARIDQPFATPLGAVMTPPLHPNCRCAVVLDVASLAIPRGVGRAA
jgi:SPP1 gp7 family putative phage head morphogenesis protein